MSIKVATETKSKQFLIWLGRLDASLLKLTKIANYYLLPEILRHYAQGSWINLRDKSPYRKTLSSCYWFSKKKNAICFILYANDGRLKLRPGRIWP